MKRIGIIGLGSIGRRHAKMLNELGIADIRALRTNKGELKKKSDQVEYVQEFSEASGFYNSLDGIIISNPTSLHVEKAMEALERGIPTFIEKPIAHNITSVNLIEKYKDKLIVGYCLRFSGFVSFIKNFIDQGNLGKIYKASFHRSYYLPKWHPYADYRKEYTAQKKLGGGVIRTLSHEIDLMLYLFGYPIDIIGYTDKVSDLEIDTDDLAYFSCKMEEGARINFELDFLSPNYINSGVIIGSKGKLEYNMNSIQFTSMEGATKKVYDFKEDEIDNMYLNQMRDFIQFIETGESKNCSFNEAIKTMEIIEKVEKK